MTNFSRHLSCGVFFHLTYFLHISHVEKFLHVTEFPHIYHVEKFSTWQHVIGRISPHDQFFLHRRRLWCLWQIWGIWVWSGLLIHFGFWAFLFSFIDGFFVCCICSHTCPPAVCVLHLYWASSAIAVQPLVTTAPASSVITATLRITWRIK